MSRAAIACFALQPQCSSGGEKNAKHMENWQILIIKLLKSVNIACQPLINPNIEESEEDADSVLVLSFEKEEYDSSPGLLHILRIQKLLLLLDSVLKQATSFVVQVPLSILIHTFCEVVKLLDIDMERRADLQLEKSLLQYHMNNLLSALMVSMATCFKQFQLSMIPFVSVTSRIALRVLMHPGSTCKPSFYYMINQMVNNCFISFENCSNLSDILSHVLKDIKVVENKEEENMHQVEPVKKSKKKNQFAKNYSKDIDLSQLNNKNWMNVTSNTVQNTKSAFKVLRTVITKADTSCSEESMELIIANLLTIYHRLCENIKGQVGQYTIDIKLDYLKTLGILLHLHSSVFCIPTSIILSIFQALKTNHSIRISTYCEEVLLNFEKVLHTSAPQWKTELVDTSDRVGNTNGLDRTGHRVKN